MDELIIDEIRFHSVLCSRALHSIHVLYCMRFSLLHFRLAHISRLIGCVCLESPLMRVESTVAESSNECSRAARRYRRHLPVLLVPLVSLSWPGDSVCVCIQIEPLGKQCGPVRCGAVLSEPPRRTQQLPRWLAVVPQVIIIIATTLR